MLGTYLNADPKDLALVPNASTAVNSVLRSIQVPYGKTLLYLNIAYGMVKNCLRYLQLTYGTELYELKVPFLGDEQGIVDAVR